MRGDGDGWVISAEGHHWGRHGAAGLLLRAPLDDGSPAVLLQHRALWSHQGGTWGLPGGALDSHEAAEEAAVREAWEEAGLAEEHIEVRTSLVTTRIVGLEDGVTWSYTTVIADARERLATVANRESTELRWVPEAEVTRLPLHPAFAESWARLRVTESVLHHDCRLSQPHTVVHKSVEGCIFAWCVGGS